MSSRNLRGTFSQRQWRWARFVLVYPDANPAWEPLAECYRSFLFNSQTFATTTFDVLVDADVLEPGVRQRLIERYRCWQAPSIG